MSTSSDAFPSGPVAGSASVGKGPSGIALIVGIVSLVVAFVLMLIGNEADPARPFLGWLIGASFWLSILIGMLFFIMITWMFDSGWSVIIRRQLEHFVGAFPLLFLIMLPLAVLSIVKSGGGLVAWIWLDADALVPGGHGSVDHDVLWIKKSGYLNETFFFIRFFAYFAVWAGLAYLLRRWSFRMDDTGDHANVHRSRRLSAAGLFLCAFATTFAAIDWFKSLNYHWFSTMYGVWFFAACMRAGFSATVLALFYLASKNEGGLKGLIQRPHFYLLGCLMLAFTVFWAYISFSQYFLIYNANIPEETFWYNMREVAADGMKNSWWWVSMALIFLHFFVPFLFLLWYNNKFGSRLKFIAVWILVFHLLDLYWNILPQKFNADTDVGYVVRQFSISIVDVLTFIGVGGIVLWSFLRSANRYRPIPIRDPRILESLHTHE